MLLRRCCSLALVCARAAAAHLRTLLMPWGRGEIAFCWSDSRGFLGSFFPAAGPREAPMLAPGRRASPVAGALSLSRGAHAWQQGDGADCAMTASCCCDCAAACEEALATIKICKRVAAVRADSMDWPSYCGSSACGASHALTAPLQRSLRSAAPQIVCWRRRFLFAQGCRTVFQFGG